MTDNFEKEDRQEYPFGGGSLMARGTAIASVIAALGFAAYTVDGANSATELDVSSVQFTAVSYSSDLSPRDRYAESRARLGSIIGSGGLALDTSYFDQAEQAGLAFLRESYEQADEAVVATSEAMQKRGSLSDYDRALLTYEVSRRDYYKSLIDARADPAS